MKNTWKWMLALSMSCLSFACVLEPNEPADSEAGLLAEEETASLAEANLITEEEPTALEPSEMLGASPDEEVETTRCCQVWIVEEPQALLCQTMSSPRFLALARCAAIAASIPFTYPKLVSGSCGNYRPGICPS
jgi:hypothetical protein